jgi:serine/threonine-protein kinase
MHYGNEMNSEKCDPADRSGSVAVSRMLARLSDRYVIDRRIGSGGTGVVYLARDVNLGRQVAIKVLHPEVSRSVGAETLRREIRLTASLQHPHTLPVLDSGCVDGAFYFITPYLGDGSLRDLIERERRLSLSSAIQIAVDVLEALAQAHANGIVHCDLKPENILLSNGHAILADFGIARTGTRASKKDPDRVSGSPAYMSPEQAAGEEMVDGRSDLFSLACVLYEILAGKPAYTGPHALAIIAKRFQGPPPNLLAECPSLPRGVAFAVAKALAVDPDDRYQTAAGFAAALVRHSASDTMSWRRGFGRSRFGRAVARLAKTAVFAVSLLLPA